MYETNHIQTIELKTRHKNIHSRDTSLKIIIKRSTYTYLKLHNINDKIDIF